MKLRSGVAIPDEVSLIRAEVTFIGLHQLPPGSKLVRVRYSDLAPSDQVNMDKVLRPAIRVRPQVWRQIQRRLFPPSKPKLVSQNASPQQDANPGAETSSASNTKPSTPFTIVR